jgi:hypothetical protein
VSVAIIFLGLALFRTGVLAQSPTPAAARSETKPVLSAGATNARLALFQDFVNGQVPVKEAVVYRRISKPDSTVANQEWWRFGCQENTWFVQRLQPDKDDPSKLVPLPGNEVIGASHEFQWIVSDKYVDAVPKTLARGSSPDTHGAFPRSLMFCALSLGLPRRTGMASIDEAAIEWNGLRFRTVVGSKRDKTGAVLETAMIEGQLTLGENGLPASAEFPGAGQFPSGSVTYEYGVDTAGIPAAFTVEYADSVRQYRYEFLSLTRAVDDASQADGYGPSQFADLNLVRLITVWTNDKPYSLIKGKLWPAFGARHIYGQEPRRNGPIILISLAAAASTILALWYRRSKKETRPGSWKGVAVLLLGFAAFASQLLAQSPTPAAARSETKPVLSAGATNARLALFQDFVNGQVPVKEAVVYRKISKPDGMIINQDWWCFGYQENTWYAERLKPAANDPTKLVRLSHDVICGASFTHLWTISDQNIHVAAKPFAVGSTPDRYGATVRNPMQASISLGLPRRLDKLELSDAPIEWDGLRFRTVRYGGPGENGVRITVPFDGDVTLDTNGLPAVARWSETHGYTGGSVFYEYGPDTQGIPTAFVCKYTKEALSYRYEFLSLTLGTNDLSETEGYVPSLFADLKQERQVTIWTNNQDYSLINGKLVSGARPAHVYGEGPKRKGVIILISLAAAVSTILALWCRRSKKER